MLVADAPRPRRGIAALLEPGDGDPQVGQRRVCPSGCSSPCSLQHSGRTAEEESYDLLDKILGKGVANKADAFYLPYLQTGHVFMLLVLWRRGR